jgi:hypothetical protein
MEARVSGAGEQSARMDLEPRHICLQEVVHQQLEKAGLLPGPFFAKVTYAHKCARRGCVTV